MSPGSVPVIIYKKVNKYIKNHKFSTRVGPKKGLKQVGVVHDIKSLNDIKSQ